MYLIWAILLILANACAWLANLVSLPGNWLIVLFSACFAWLTADEPELGIGWLTVGVLVGIAAFGEVVELMAGAAVAGKRGGSRRGMALAIVGTLVGSIAGAFMTIPIPVVGPIIGAVAGGAAGAFVGAWMGELWKGRTAVEGYHIAAGAVLGRLLGTAGKLVVGAVMVVIAAVDALNG